jgi:hypothetical protein
MASWFGGLSRRTHPKIVPDGAQRTGAKLMKRAAYEHGSPFRWWTVQPTHKHSNALPHRDTSADEGADLAIACPAHRGTREIGFDDILPRECIYLCLLFSSIIQCFSGRFLKSLSEKPRGNPAEVDCSISNDLSGFTPFPGSPHLCVGLRCTAAPEWPEP